MAPSSKTTRRAGLVPLVLAGACSCGPDEPVEVDTPAPRLTFTDQGEAAGVDLLNWCGSDRDRKVAILESIGQGAAWLDDDGDGHLDLFLVNGSTIEDPPTPLPASAYYRARGDGTYEEVGEELGVADSAWGNAVAAADMDNDGDTDLFVTNWGPHILYRNTGAGFEEIGAKAGVQCLLEGDQMNWGAGAAWGDIDLDGFLDLFVAHYLVFDPRHPPGGGGTQNWKGIREAYYGPLGCVPIQDALFRNRGDGTFEDVSVESGLATPVPAYSLGGIFSDVDLDGDPDLYVANDSMANYLFVNDGKGGLSERGELKGLAYGEQGNAQAGMGLDAADFDGDGDDEIVVTNFDDDVNTLYRNDGHVFRDITVRSGLAAPGRNQLCWGIGLVDLDGDVDLDVFIADGHVYHRAETDDPATSYLQRNLLLENRLGKLEDVSETAGPGLQVREVSRGAAFGDYDADGDVDVLVVNLNRPPTLLRNDTENHGSSLQVRLVGSRSNRDGVGARVTVSFGGVERSAERRAGASFLSTNSPWLHFGLGSTQRVDRVSVRWPSGVVSEHGPFDLDEVGGRVVLEEPAR